MGRGGERAYEPPTPFTPRFALFVTECPDVTDAWGALSARLNATNTCVGGFECELEEVYYAPQDNCEGKPRPVIMLLQLLSMYQNHQI